MAVMKCVTESVFSCRFLFVKLQAFTVNGSDRVCDRICFFKTQVLKMSAMKSVPEFMADSVTGSVFSLKL